MRLSNMTPGVVAAAVCLHACDRPAEPEAPPEPIAASQAALVPETDNSPYYAELTYIAGMGLVDGTTCDSWPKDFPFDQPSPTSASQDALSAGDALPALTQQLPAPIAGTTGPVLERLVDVAQQLGIDTATVFGSKYRLDVRTIIGPDGDPMVVAIDTRTQTGFALSRPWMCTEALARSSQCDAWLLDLNLNPVKDTAESDPSDPSSTMYRILVRDRRAKIEPSTPRTLAVVTAPSIMQFGDISLDSDAVFVAESFFGAGKLTFEPVPYAYDYSDWPRALTFSPVAPLGGIIADDVGAFDIRMYNGGGTDGVMISSNSPSFSSRARTSIHNPIGTWSAMKVNAGDLFAPSTSTQPLPLPTTFTNLADFVYFNEDGGYSYVAYTADEVTHEEVVVNLAVNIVPRHSVTDAPEFFLACEGGAACEATYASQRIQLHGSSAVRLDGIELADFVDRTLANYADPNHAPHACVGQLAPRNGTHCYRDHATGQHSIRKNGAHLNASRAACRAAAQADPVEVRQCRTTDLVRVCLRFPNSTNPTCVTVSQYQPGDPSHRARFTQQLESLVRNRLFGPQPSQPNLQPRAPLFNTLALGYPTSPMGNLFSRGALLDLRVDGLENASLRTGEVGSDWHSLELDTLASLPVDPHTGSTFELDDGPRAAEGLGLLRSTTRHLHERAFQAQVNARKELATNVLGLPYGPTGAGWSQPPPQSGGTTFYLEQLSARWQDLATDVEAIDQAVRLGNLQGGISQLSQKSEALAKASREFADQRATELEGQVASVQATAKRLDELRVHVEDQRMEFEKTLGQVWNCDATLPPTDPGSCQEAMNRRLNSLTAACVAASQDNRLMALINLLSTFSSYLSTFVAVADVLTKTILPNALNFLSASPEVASVFADVNRFLEDAVEVAKKAKQLVDNAKKMSGYISRLVEAVQQAPCDQSLPEYQAIAAHFTDLLNTTATLGQLSVSTAELSTLVQRFSDDVRFYRASHGHYTELRDELGDIEDALGQGGIAHDGIELKTSLVRYMCPLAQASLKSSLSDVHAATRSLATTTGDGAMKPYLHVPADPGYPQPIASSVSGWRDYPTDHGFLISLWDIDRFRRTVLDPTGSFSSGVVNQLVSRFENYKLSEVCRGSHGTAPSFLPEGAYLLHHRISGPALDNFLMSPNAQSQADRLTFELDLDDIVRAGNDQGPDAHVAGVFDNLVSGQWMDRSSPVVLGVAYSVQRTSGLLDFTAPHGGWSGLGLVAPSSSWMPTADCSPDTISEVLIDEHGQDYAIGACLVPLQMQRPGSEVITSLASQGITQPGDLRKRYVAVSGGSQFCQSSFGQLVPDGLQGRPALGVWTLTYDRSTAWAAAHELATLPTSLEPDKNWRLANQDVEAIDLYFVLGAEVRTHQEAPNFERITP